MLQLVEFQREIYAQVAEQIKAFGADGGALVLLALLPMGLLFGAAHALTPGHNKIVLATYVAGSQISMTRALLATLLLSFTHILMAVLIAVLALPLVSVTLGSVGRAPALENISRALLAVIGLWMVFRAIRSGHRHQHEGEAMGFAAGLIPCPLTLFVMTFAISRGVPEAGLVFAAAMLGGVTLTLAVVALSSLFLRVRLAGLLCDRPRLLHGASRALEGLAGCVLVVIAGLEIIR